MPSPVTAILAPALAAALFAAPARAQDPPKPEPTKTPEAARSAERRERAPSLMLRVQVVISRFQGEKKIASLPYTFTVATEGRAVRMRMGVDTPVPVFSGRTPETGDKPAYSYRNVGTSLDCNARDLGEGRYQLQLGVESSSALTGVGSSLEGVPLFRRFDTSLDPILRDGQSIQTIASTDPVTGEVVRIDVTLNVVR